MTRRKLFCCEASRDQYADYYMRQLQQQHQTGGELPAFVGAARQRGHGIGSVLAGLFRRVMPFLRNNARNFGASAIKTGLHVAGDVMQGQKFVESVKRRVPEGIKTAAQNVRWPKGDGLHAVQSNSRASNVGTKRKRSKSAGVRQSTKRRHVVAAVKTQMSTRKRKSTSHSDIFCY